MSAGCGATSPVELNHTKPHHAETHGFFGLFCSYAGGGVKWRMSLCGLERFRSLQNLLLAVIAVGVGAAAVAVVSIVTPRLLPVPLPEPVADKATGLVVGGKLLLLAAVGAAVALVAAAAVALQ